MISAYNDFRMKVATGDLFFTHSKALFSRIIRFFTRSTVSHVGVFFWIENRLFIGEMLEGKGCRMMLASERFKNEEFFWGVPSNRMRYNDEIITDILDCVGREEYSMLGAILAPFITTPSSKNICSGWATQVTGQKFEALERGILPIDLVAKCRTFTLVTK
jgi:hypothetical protein